MRTTAPSRYCWASPAPAARARSRCPTVSAKFDQRIRGWGEEHCHAYAIQAHRDCLDCPTRGIVSVRICMTASNHRANAPCIDDVIAPLNLFLQRRLQGPWGNGVSTTIGNHHHHNQTASAPCSLSNHTSLVKTRRYCCAQQCIGLVRFNPSIFFFYADTCNVDVCLHAHFWE